MDSTRSSRNLLAMLSLPECLPQPPQSSSLPLQLNTSHRRSMLRPPSTSQHNPQNWLPHNRSSHRQRFTQHRIKCTRPRNKSIRHPIMFTLPRSSNSRPWPTINPQLFPTLRWCPPLITLQSTPINPTTTHQLFTRTAHWHIMRRLPPSFTIKSCSNWKSVLNLLVVKASSSSVKLPEPFQLSFSRFWHFLSRINCELPSP